MPKLLRRAWTAILGLIAFIRLVRNPNQLELVFNISQRVAEPEILRLMGDHAATQSSEARIAFEKLTRLDLKLITQPAQPLPEGSLGQEFLTFLRVNHLNPSDIPTLPGKTREEYVLAHLYETHDLWHVLCGFETDVSGELGLQAFYLAQLPAPLASILLAAGFLNTALFAIGEREQRMSEILRGWSAGRKAKPLFGVDWNQYWEMPLGEVRARFSLN